MADMLDTTSTSNRLRRTARRLRAGLLNLDEMKTGRGQVRSERVMRATPGPAAPGNARAIHLSIELDGFLDELCKDLRNQVEPGRVLPEDGPGLCEWIAFNAYPIAETIDWTDDLIDALDGYVARVHRVTGSDEPDHRPHEPRQFAPAICQRLAALGYSATPENLQLWHHRSAGAVSVRKREGKNLYLLSEVLAWITRKQPIDGTETTPENPAAAVD